MTRSEAFDRRDPRAGGLCQRHEASVDRAAIDENGAGAALPFPTPFFRSRQPAVLPQCVKQTLHRMRIEPDAFAVQEEPCHGRIMVGIRD